MKMKHHIIHFLHYIIFLVFELIVKTVPVFTEKTSSKIGSPSESSNVLPSESFFLIQF